MADIGNLCFWNILDMPKTLAARGCKRRLIGIYHWQTCNSSSWWWRFFFCILGGKKPISRNKPKWGAKAHVSNDHLAFLRMIMQDMKGGHQTGNLVREQKVTTWKTPWNDRHFYISLQRPGFDLRKSYPPGDSSRDLFIPDRWRSLNHPKKGHVNSPSQKGHDRRFCQALISPQLIHPWYIIPKMRDASTEWIFQVWPEFFSPSPSPPKSGSRWSLSWKRATQQTNTHPSGGGFLSRGVSSSFFLTPQKSLKCN